MIYMNHAATSYKRPPEVAEAVMGAMSSMGNEFRGSSAGEMNAARTIFGCRKKLAELFCFPHPDRVVLTANATTAMNMVLLGSFSIGDTVIATDWDHNCVLRPLHILKQQGVRVLWWKADRSGQLDTDDLRKMIKENGRSGIRALICTHASNLTGRILDLAAVSEITEEYGIRLIVDASQTAGALPIDMEALGIDVLVFTGHKSLMGPQGTGGMCVVPSFYIRPLISGGTGFLSYEQEQPESWPAHLEAGTPNGHGIAGLKTAAEYILEKGPEAIHRREMELTKRFLRGIIGIEGVKIYGWDDLTEDEASLYRGSPKPDAGRNAVPYDGTGMTRTGHMPVVALNIRNLPSEEVADILAEHFGIAVRAGAHCAPRMHMALGTMQQGAVRFSFGYFNTEEEIDTAIAALKEIAGG